MALIAFLQGLLIGSQMLSLLVLVASWVLIVANQSASVGARLQTSFGRAILVVIGIDIALLCLTGLVLVAYNWRSLSFGRGLHFE
jgi:hypothetical protein